MNQIRAIQALNKREIEHGISPEASWHVDYRDTAFVNFGGLPYELNEGDVITIFSQFGEPVFLKLARDKETGKSKGFGWLKYEDQRSCDLAVDNLGGAEIAGRLVRVDHARYKLRDDEDPEEGKVGWEDIMRKEGGAGRGVESDGDEEEEEEEEERARPMLKEEKELQLLIENHDDDDPMKSFLIDEKKKEIEEALRKESKRAERHKRHKDGHHHRSHRSRRDRDDDDDRKERSRRDGTPVDRKRGDDEESREKRHHRSRRDSRDRDSRRDRDRDGKREERGERDRDEARPRDSERDRRRERDRSRDRRHRDSEDRHRRDRRRDRSKSP